MNTHLKSVILPVVGNDGMASLVHPWCELYRVHHPETRFQCTLEGSSTAVMALAADASWLAPMSRAPWPHELDAFRHVKGYLPTAIHIGYTGHGPRSNAKSPPSIYMHSSNPLAGLTITQMAAIFSRGHSDGDINTWGQLGVEGKWKNRRIHLYGLRDDGKYATAFRYAHLGGRFYPLHYEELADRQAVASAVADDPFGLGCLGWFNAAAFSDQVRIVPLASSRGEPYFSPDLCNVQRGRYPLSSYVSIYVDLPPDCKLDQCRKEWIAGALSPAGQDIVAAQTHSNEGYVPLGPEELARQIKRLSLL